MGVCDTTRELAEAIAASGRVEQPRQRLQIELLRLMPLYLAIGDLSLWEKAYQSTLPRQDDESALGLLLMETFDFARYNLYGAFDVDGTGEQYALVRALFARQGIALPAQAELAGW